MSIYDPKSLRAEEFINHEEILATLAYAEENKNNRELIEQILEKAAPKKTKRGVECAGLSHREASVLLACDIPELTEKMYALAREIKEAFYGNRIVMFAPLYLSNYCVNKCVYCPYHYQNKEKKNAVHTFYSCPCPDHLAHGRAQRPETAGLSGLHHHRHYYSIRINLHLAFQFR